MNRNREALLWRNGAEIIRGCDVDGYPRHHFCYYSPQPGTTPPPLYVRFAGRDEWIPGCFRKRENSRLFVIEVLRRGRMRYRVNGRDILVEPGGAVVIPKASVSTMEAERPSEKWVLCLEGGALEVLAKQAGLFSGGFLPQVDPSEAARRISSLERLMREKPADWIWAVSSGCYDFLLFLSRTAARDTRPRELAALQDYIDGNLSRPLRVEDLCRRLNRSKSSLNRLFASQLGQSPMEYVIRRRMALARDLLLHTSQSIKEIALRTGYADQLYFSQEFKKRNDAGPREFRRGGGEGRG